MGEIVTLLVYDLSQGMAKNMSFALTGTQIDGIWHTAVIVYGKEYAFGQGVEEFTPGMINHYGNPVDRITMGETFIPKDVFIEFMETMKSIWTADKYHLLDNNCNSFSNELCQFLVGKNIPSHITGLPADVLNTPFGQSILPMIEGMYGKSSVAKKVPALSLTSKIVKSCTNLPALNNFLSSHRCVVVDFTSESCPPCRVISPEFETLIADTNGKVIGLKVETNAARDICMKFQITVTPTFKFFLDGNEFITMKGANRAELKSNIDLLVYTAFPPHPHQKLDLSNLIQLTLSPAINFVVSSNLDSIFKKLNEIVVESNPSINVESLQTLKDWMKNTDFQSNPILPHDWFVTPFELLYSLQTKKLYPLLDILRLLVLNQSIRKYFISDKEVTYVKVIQRILAEQDVGTPTKLMLLRFICNLFDKTDYTKSFALLSNIESHGTSARSEITSLVVDTLLSADHQLRQASSLLVFNISWTQSQLRTDTTSIDDEGWAAELVAAVCDAIEKESTSDKPDDETAIRLLGSLGLLLGYSSDPNIELAIVVGVESHIDTIMKVRDGEKRQIIQSLGNEIKLILGNQ